MKIFMLAGKARHGKTTTAGFIKEYYESKNTKAIVTAIGKYLKMYTKDMSDWDGSVENKPRTFMQNLATNIRENMGSDFFIRRTLEDIKVYASEFDVVVIDDIRLPIEIEYIKESYPDAKIFKMIRPDFETDLNAKEQKHVTETALNEFDGYDLTIENNGTLEDLRNKIFEILEGLEK